MNKIDFAQELKTLKSRISSLAKQIQVSKKKQLHSKTILTQLEEAATLWFDSFESSLRHFYSIDTTIIDSYHTWFGTLIELSTMNPATSSVLNVLEELQRNWNQDLLVPVLSFQKEVSKHGSYDVILENKSGVELEYLKEAVECANEGHFRAALVLGWAAAIDRMHQIVVKNGLPHFNHASTQMSKLKHGRYKRFNKTFDIQNLSDLRMSVFDNDLLWVLEFLGLIDGNEHDKLGICFTMRNSCAHPGDAPVTPENVASFFSDINALIFKNAKFTL